MMNKKKKSFWLSSRSLKKGVIVFALTIALFFTTSGFVNKGAEAHCCSQWSQLRASVVREWRITDRDIKTFVQQEFSDHRQWITSVLWEDHLLPAMMMMADQLSAVSMQQTQIIGSFIDAKHQMETQRVLQTVRARAHKDYHPSTGMCEFGSSVKSLAASERRSELNAHVMSQRSQDRQLGNANSAAAGGPDSDVKNRLNQFKEKFCDTSDNDKGLDLLCTHAGGIGAIDPERVNKDIDYTRTVQSPWTLNIDFTDATPTHEEEEVMALASNLYGQNVFERIKEPVLSKNSSDNPRAFTATRGNYMDARALLAKQSVAENSFNAITSMKSAGTSGSREFLESILTELGVDGTSGPPDDILRMLGMDDSNAEIGPSYHAQMEVLTKKIYQNPDFYTNLYDKPVNVDRKKVAMQAIGLMQKFDLFKSYLRNEANIAVLLELAVIDLQGHVENELSE